MAKIDMLTDVAERLAEYKMFYPDATITRVGFEDCNSISLDLKIYILFLNITN